jgi:transcriptional regulator with XRE-family HTH domain
VTTFGERLKSLRRTAGLSQGELAGGDLSASYISLLEAGKRSPSPEVVNLLAARLGCSRSQLVEGRQSDRDRLIALELAYAKLAIEHGESVDARGRLERLLADDGVPLDSRDEAAFLLATALERLGEHTASVRVLQPLFTRATQRQTSIPVILVAQVLCRAHLDSGDLNRAGQVGESALSVAREQGLGGTTEYFRLAATVMHAYIQMGDFVHARTWADTFIAEARDAGEMAGQAVLYWNSALIAEYEGNVEEALRLCEQAMGRLSELDNLRDFARVRLATAEIMLYADPPDGKRAGDLLDSALSDLRDLGSRHDQGLWNRAKSGTLLLQGDRSGAEGRARQALDLFIGLSPEDAAFAWVMLHDTLVAQGRTGEAVECLDEAAGIAETLRAGRSQAFLWREVAERYSACDNLEAAVHAFRRSLTAGGIRDRTRGIRLAARELRSAESPGRAQHSVSTGQI